MECQGAGAVDAEVYMREGKLMVNDEVEFRNYRKSGPETTITFGVPDPLSSDQPEEQPVKP